MGPDGQRLTCLPAAAAPVVVVELDYGDEDKPQEVFLKDYKPTPYTFETVYLNFELGEEVTFVSSRIRVKPQCSGHVGVELQGPFHPSPLILDGSDLKLLEIKINGDKLASEAYRVTSKRLIITSPPPGAFDLEVRTEIEPQNNTALEGLYKSSGNFCTQCEAEGFRKITYYLDRPDVMAVFTVHIVADKKQYPVLLSNGNLVAEGDLEDGKHFCTWEDPFKKPCYLFALVAGDLACTEDSFVTKSGRQVTLRIWVQEHNKTKTGHAMQSLKAAMKWDEDVFGLEYDLDLFNIVAVDDFNMGAMENKSLNIFNSRLILASPETATDADYTSIEGVVAHEYFHNWTGNRVTCRDWFQLSLKEGLTVFRDQEFSCDMNCRPVARIGDVLFLRMSQFPEDASPMSHPVRPASYIKMDNFYTVTVYEKGAEVVRMYKTLFGKEGFRKGMDLYFRRHDGQAVTCDDFLAAMRDANDGNMGNFARWYSQAGTPELTVATSYDEKAKTLTLRCSQHVPPTAGQPLKEPAFIPFAVGLLGKDGNDIPLHAVYDGSKLLDLGGKDVFTAVLRVEEKEHVFTFTGIPERPIPSLLRDFSAPVRLFHDLTDEDLVFLLAHDSDAFNRWEAAQTLAKKLMLDLVKKQQKGEELVMHDGFVNAIGSVLTDKSLDKALIARTVTMPSQTELADLMDVADPDAIHFVQRFVIRQLALRLRAQLMEVYVSNQSDEPYVPDHPSKARRSLKNAALGYLSYLNEPEITAMAKEAFGSAKNMTDQFAALAALARNPGEERESALDSFYKQWEKDPLVVNKWLALQAMSEIPGNVAKVRQLLVHPSFDIKNPNKVRSVVASFMACPINFHAADGSGYEFAADMVIRLDPINAQVAARLAGGFKRYRKYDEKRQALVKAQLERISAANGLSENVFEIVTKCLTA
ncbi:hypothetical protein CBR_g951 [Chara braunii]|uniref:Aminopeptidase N n=1 Tax=Chara braunii TaxID=69332 RepID=A0A388KCP7_CHABU|nr:hypothetical protein CBR_g951 [Chara braunii]|eukprot:GBG67830.1 hypothetical protein CBR_g951 [Chara braunii]